VPMAYDNSFLKDMTPEELVNRVAQTSNGFELPGWEPERLGALKSLLKQYQGVDEEQLFQNLKYFLDGILPV